MLTAEEKRELFKKISGKRREISQLQAELNSVNDKKEHWFSEKTGLSHKISSLIKEIKEDRQERNSLTREVRKGKEDRDRYNKAVREAVNGIKELEKERDDLLRKHKIKDPTSIIKQISAFEMKIETEPMSFDKEKQIMKKIKDLKKKLVEAKAVSGIIEKIQAMSDEIDKKKRTAQESHKRVQTYAKKSQERHESLIEASNEIDILKNEEEKAFKNFIDNKLLFNELNEQLKKHLTELKELSEKAQKNRIHIRKLSEKNKRETLEQKKVSVEEKIKKGMKLTTEDLLAYQGAQKD